MVSLHRFSLQDGTHERSKVIGDLLVRDGGFLEPPNLWTELGVAQRPHGTMVEGPWAITERQQNHSATFEDAMSYSRPPEGDDT